MGLSPALAQDRDPKPSCLWEDRPPSGAREGTGPSPLPRSRTPGTCNSSSFEEESWRVCVSHQPSK